MLLILLVFLGICVNYTRNAALTNAELKKYKNLIEGQGLYSANEDVYVLTANNFKKQLYGKPHANLVEFYNAWCGFCRRFQPTWSALATDIKNWKDIVVVSAFDCSDDDNVPICREFEIMHYPTLRYFHENYEEGDKQLGVDVPAGRDMHAHKTELVRQIIREQYEGRAKMIPNIIEYIHHDLSHIFENVPEGTLYVFLIVIPLDDEILGAEVALELHRIRSISVRYAYNNNTELLTVIKEGVTVFSRDAPNVPIVLDVVKPYTRVTLVTAIKQFLQPRNIYIPAPTRRTDLFTGKWNDVQVPSADDLQEAREKVSLRQRIKKMGDTVFQVDLETTLRYSLKHEIALSKTISGEKLTALRKYLSVILNYFPLGPAGHDFIQRLLDDVTASRGILTGDTFAAWLKQAEVSGQSLFASSKPQWLACEGSSPNFRGYPCGLWKMFHYLTVNAANGQEEAPREVLEAMLGYVRHFFGCTDCSQHFQDMAEEKDMKDVASLDSAILWLWMAHNSVNKRLAGDTTEDPEYPKIQFPSKQNCPTCYESDSTWNLPEVLRYLKTVYNKSNVRYIGSDPRVLNINVDNSSSSASSFRQFDTTPTLH